MPLAVSPSPMPEAGSAEATTAPVASSRLSSTSRSGLEGETPAARVSVPLQEPSR